MLAMKNRESVQSVDEDPSSSSWAQFDFIFEDSESAVEPIPPQLHPAVSFGMKRVSSCYMSVPSEASNSVADLLSLIDEGEVDSATWTTDSESDLLYHDILMHVFTFLDAPSLASFSQTARRPNFECFYFLQLQLQRALVQNAPLNDRLASLPGSGCVRRLAALDRAAAEDAVQAFLQSNSTLRTMPLSHSLAYLRQVLLGKSKDGANKHPALASAALLITLAGMASFMSGSAETMMTELSFGSGELPNMLFSVGFVGSLMGAARTMSDRQRAEQLTKSIQVASPRFSRLMHAAYCAAYGYSEHHQDPPRSFLTPNPYDHSEESKAEETIKQEIDRKIPSGCVGAYSRAVTIASSRVISLLKDKRKTAYWALPDLKRERIGRSFIDACCSDDALDIVKDYVQVQNIVDVEGFYVGSDGTETCALHAAAFHGSCRTLDFLCRGIDEWDSSQDGGLCNVNLRDSNGWTAAHFAAGANSPEAIRILDRYGASLSTEAANGYTPLQWAIRLQNKEVAEELRQLTGIEKPLGWIARQPLSAIARSFFALIPTH